MEDATQGGINYHLSWTILSGMPVLNNVDFCKEERDRFHRCIFRLKISAVSECFTSDSSKSDSFVACLFPFQQVGFIVRMRTLDVTLKAVEQLLALQTNSWLVGFCMGQLSDVGDKT